MELIHSPREGALLMKVTKKTKILFITFGIVGLLLAVVVNFS